MTPADIHADVLAGLDRLEAIARATQPFGAWYHVSGRDVEGRITTALFHPDDGPEPEDPDDWIFTAATRGDADHIVAQQPKTVLAVLAGRRRIIERHAPVELSKFPEEPWFCSACIDRPDFRGGSAADWPCADYRDAAADLLPGGV